jgi:hypothetical protein
MKSSALTARLRKIAADIEAFALREDHDLQYEVVLHFIVNAFTGGNALKVLGQPPVAKDQTP